ncbi:MAG: DNA mismatch repair endonuclease MutL [Bacteroides sp.]|nr:DNA mismatch repair endonuclease MutL [Roseburia sp.]MCM1345783.1 DNA mismatch repair endonuclease MutL [Bacteroides sp.]MCM1420122.1 DNA mismatch repair endonuclease MutL [Bacteroides sp.]
MDDIIHLLPDSVANQIAAGEVVQRPASIVKEMVENSIDADAQHIQVLIVDGGKTCVQVIDDGKGMSETDARLSFERHATSKILKASDLFSLTTMGFRGEALASIAAVAQIELKTRRKEDELGTYIRISGSKIEQQEPVACSSGCNFSVKNLFFNVPARRKFLKSNQTELSNILTDFERIVLVYPDISFTLYNNGGEMYNLPQSSLRKRIVDVFGKKINTELLPIEAETSLVKISGYVGKPEASRKKGSRQFFFVNGRYMRHPYFHSAVMHAYENMIPAGEQISYFIYLSVDASTIDVNVHPTKTEIKFDNEQPIWQVIAAVVKETLGKFSNVPVIDFDVEGRPDIPAMGLSRPVTPQQPKPITTTYNPFKTTASRHAQQNSTDWERLYEKENQKENIPSGTYIPSFNINNEDTEQPTIIGSRINDNMSDTDTTVYALTPHLVPSKITGDENISIITEDDSAGSQPKLWNEKENIHSNDIADISMPRFQLKGRYIVQPAKAGLILIDQHRAHQRILYDKYMEDLRGHKSASQGMLFPEIVQFSKSETAFFDNIMPELEHIGFELTNLGGGSYSISGVPSGIEGISPDKLIHNIVSSAIEKKGYVIDEIRSSIAMTMARSVAVVYGQVLSDKEMQQIVSDLFESLSSARTPDGKNIYHIISTHDIEKLF